MSTTTKELNMIFGNADGNKNIKLEAPLDTLDSEIVSTAMNDIVALETLMDSKGNLLSDVVGAEIVTTTVDTLF